MTKILAVLAIASAAALSGCALPPAMVIAGQIAAPILVDAYCSSANAKNRAVVRKAVWRDPDLTIITRDDC